MYSDLTRDERFRLAPEDKIEYRLQNPNNGMLIFYESGAGIYSDPALVIPQMRKLSFRLETIKKLTGDDRVRHFYFEHDDNWTLKVFLKKDPK